MQHASKLIMIPENRYNALTNQQHLLPPVAGQMAELDREMQQILVDQSVSPEQRLAMYQRALKQYSTVRDNAFNQSIYVRQPEEVSQKSSEAAAATPTKGMVFPAASIMETMPKTLAKKAAILLEHIRGHPDKFGLSDKNEVIIDGKLLPNSNITDLVHEVVRGRALRDLPGSGKFASALAETNVPRETMIDKDRLQMLINADVFSTPSMYDTNKLGASPAQRKRYMQLTQSPSTKGSAFMDDELY